MTLDGSFGVSNIMITDTHDNDICAQKLNRNRTFFNRCTISWTQGFKAVHASRNVITVNTWSEYLTLVLVEYYKVVVSQLPLNLHEYFILKTLI